MPVALGVADDDEARNVLGVYERQGLAWAGLRSQALVERAWLDRFMSLLPAGGAVLDIGCGSGLPIGRALMACGFALTGVDGAATMLALFRRNLPGAAAHRMDMRMLDLPGRFAGLLAWDSLFHLSPVDQRGMFARFRALALPGAALMFTSGSEEGSALGVLEGETLYHGSLDTGEYRMRLEQHGFEVVAHVASDPDCGDRAVWLARQQG
jgi:SAM-dependent methyltransferase